MKTGKEGNTGSWPGDLLCEYALGIRTGVRQEALISGNLDFGKYLYFSCSWKKTKFQIHHFLVMKFK